MAKKQIFGKEEAVITKNERITCGEYYQKLLRLIMSDPNQYDAVSIADDIYTGTGVDMGTNAEDIIDWLAEHIDDKNTVVQPKLFPYFDKLFK